MTTATANHSQGSSDDTDLVFFHNPWSRALVIHWLLEELAVPYRTQIIDIQHPENIPDDYRLVQGHNKVPAIRHRGAVVSERAAIAIYLADAFPETSLAPAVGTPERAAFLTWLVYADAVLDPAVSAHMYQWPYEPERVSFGSLDDALANIERQLGKHDYVAGDRFSAADVIFGGMLYWLVRMSKAIPERPGYTAYLDRLSARPAFQRTVGSV